MDEQPEQPEEDECFTCGEGGFPLNECPKSERQCGHHCNCSWVHDCCHWCGVEFHGDGLEVWPDGTTVQRES